ncbi:right-handed parallel beta-helix repeat-containing protein [Candidatus Saccharibacteria bacterium]|nr:right-handed parallel beta-helix repeat-containing protein [Candidatus Saccharibacteria bacterium]
MTINKKQGQSAISQKDSPTQNYKLSDIRRDFFRRKILLWVACFALGGAIITPFARAQNIYSAPESIASDCSRDVTGDINSWIKSIPDDSIILFKANGCYKIEGSIALLTRSNLEINGQNATFKSDTDGSTSPQIDGHPDRLWPRQRAHWFIKNSSTISIKNISIDGPNTKAGANNDAYRSEFEEQHGIMIYTSTGISVNNISVTETYGDFIAVFGGSRQITIANNNFDRTGRQGVSVVNGSDVVIENNKIANVGRSAIDLEPAVASWRVENVLVRNNIFGPANGVFLASLGSGANVENIVVSNNTLLGIRLYGVIETNDKTNQGLRKRGFQILNNKSDQVTGTTVAPLRFENVNDITISGNYQKVAGRLVDNGNVIYSGVSVWLTGVNNAIVRDNVFPVHFTPSKQNTTTTILYTQNTNNIISCNNILNANEKPPAIDGSCPINTPTNAAAIKPESNVTMNNNSPQPGNNQPNNINDGGSENIYTSPINVPNATEEQIIANSKVTKPISIKNIWNWPIIILIGSSITVVSFLIYKWLQRQHQRNIETHIGLNIGA